jgi:hypothetical protein
LDVTILAFSCRHFSSLNGVQALVFTGARRNVREK